MPYHLGVDLGTTYTAAAVWRDGQVEIAGLGTRAPVVPSVVLRRDDGILLTGEAAERRAAIQPLRVAREFKRRVGDPTPIILGDTSYSADALMAQMLRSVVDAVAQREGAWPASIMVSHPANWGPFKLDLLQHTICLAGLGDAHVGTVPEPEAAAIHYASQQRVDPGGVLAVYDLGGGTFDAGVLRRTMGGWEVLGTPEGVEHLGGIDFDEAVFHHVRTAIGEPFDRLHPEDPAAMAAVARLRQECVAAKEALSSDADVSIPVLLPNLQTEVRLVRAQLEDMIRPALVDTVNSLRRALRSADVELDDVSAVLLVGGSSRAPLVAQLVGSELRRPVAVDAHPKHAVARGAAIVAAERAAGRVLGTQVVPPREAFGPAPLAAPAAGWHGGAVAVVGDEPTIVRPRIAVPPRKAVPAPPPARRRWVPWSGAAVLALVAATVGALTVNPLSAGEEPSNSSSGSSSIPSSVPVAASEEPAVSSVSVAALEPGWTDTEIDLAAGDEVKITATGEIVDDVNRHPDRTFPPDGVPDLRGEHTGDRFRDINHAALIGRIGDDGEVFAVGADRQVTVSTPGRLQLAINDSRFDDNQGSFDAEITVTPAESTRAAADRATSFGRR